jgi:hypothetical protein
LENESRTEVERWTSAPLPLTYAGSVAKGKAHTYPHMAREARIGQGYTSHTCALLLRGDRGSSQTRACLGLDSFRAFATGLSEWMIASMEQRAPITNALSARTDIPTVSRYFPNGMVIELLYDPEERTTAFAVWENGRWRIERDVTFAGERLVPFSARNNLISNEAVLLPSRPEEYGSEHELVAAIQAHIHRYADLSPSFELAATYYVLLTWVYDAFSDLPYLRFRGDFGTGKTRSLLTIGSICYKPFFASGTSTISPIFHTLDAFRGTLIFDEADFRFSDERSEIVKILNNGNVRGMPVLRTMMNHQKEFNPRAFDVFGPKIVATRGHYDDAGLESRFITEDTGARPLREGVPLNLPETFKREARELRNKLLLYRFHRKHDVRLDPSLADRRLEPRLNQIMLPLLSVVAEPSLRVELRNVALSAQVAIVAERSSLMEAQVLEVLWELLLASSRPIVPIAHVTAALIERYGSQYERPITNRWIGSVIRKKLNLQTYKSGGVYVIPKAQQQKIALLCARYGVGNNLDLPTADSDMDVGR